jgi:hypothetical protein
LAGSPCGDSTDCRFFLSFTDLPRVDHTVVLMVHVHAKTLAIYVLQIMNAVTPIYVHLKHQIPMPNGFNSCAVFQI